MLFDTGTWSNYDVGKFIVAPFLRREGIKKIDTIVISHEHDDHCNGIPSLIERFKINNVFVNKFFLQSGNKEKLLRLISEKKISTDLLAKGLEIKGYEPAKIKVLNPPDKDILRYEGFPVNNLSVNDSSSVVLIEYLGYKILLCADIGESGIEMLLSGKDDLNADVFADVVQVPHHGGFCVKTEDLIRRVRPKHALISGTEKIVSISTVEAYEKFGVDLFKTYQDGAITFTINEDGIQVSRFLQR
jgi:competence protein ComEC